jgi:hypothetical protein
VTPEQERIHNDLMRHLRTKVRRAIADHLDTCHRVDLDSDHICAGVAETLLHIFASYVSMCMEMSPQQFAKLCLQAYQAHLKILKTEEEGQKSSKEGD